MCDAALHLSLIGPEISRDRDLAVAHIWKPQPPTADLDLFVCLVGALGLELELPAAGFLRAKLSLICAPALKALEGSSPKLHLHGLALRVGRVHQQ